jgi:acyl dehydratase
MTKVSQLSAKEVEEIKRLVGKEFAPYSIEVEKTVIRRLAEAMGDENPLWQDHDSEKSSRKEIMAPPALCFSMMTYGFIPGVTVLLKRGLDAAHSWKFHAPIRAGDVLTVRSKIVDSYERQGNKFGIMVFLVFETLLTNQEGEKVCTHRGTMLWY